MQTSTFTINKDVPRVVEFTGLLPDTEYFYRINYRESDSKSSYIAGPGRFFHTSRPTGSTFMFALEADPHMDNNSDSAAYAQTLQNILAEKPDFLFDLGDNFMSEKLPVINQNTITGRHLLLRSFYAQACHSIPLFLILGNHEGELGWKLDGTENSLPVMASNTRKLYFPNPVPNAYYSGNTKEEPFVGLRENYYAFEWGDALFVVLDPFWYTLKKPGWGWTLGFEQYNWFKATLSESEAKFKFVFCHNLVGGYGNDARGGAEFVDFFEMGGYNADGTYAFDENRPGWQESIHSLMKENNVNIFFHGHDHFFGKQEKDGIIYQEVPQPSNNNITRISAAEYGYVDGVFLPGRGYLRVTVSPENVKVDYVRSYLPAEENATQKNREIAYSYTIENVTSAIDNQNENMQFPAIEQNYPNPFTQRTKIIYRIPEKNNVEIKIFNLFGKEVTTLASQIQEPGSYSVSFDAENENIPEGMYLCQLQTGNYIRTIKMIYSSSFKYDGND